MSNNLPDDQKKLHQEAVYAAGLNHLRGALETAFIAQGKQAQIMRWYGPGVSGFETLIVRANGGMAEINVGVKGITVTGLGLFFNGFSNSPGGRKRAAKKVAQRLCAP